MQNTPPGSTSDPSSIIRRHTARGTEDKLLVVGNASYALDADRHAILPYQGQLTDDLLLSVACVLVDATDADGAWRVLRAIRQNPRPLIYLKPVVLLQSAERKAPPSLQAAADGVLAVDGAGNVNLAPLGEWIGLIGHKVRDIYDVDSVRDTQSALKLIRLLHTRTSPLVPERSIRTPYGYSFPILEVLTQDEAHPLLFVQQLEEQNFLAGEFVDRVYLCYHCHSAFLNFRETCPHCNSPDLDQDDLVHHFRCAYMGPMQDYRRANRLICPKCDRELQQIGVDYDKPSSIFTCNQCSHASQDPDVMTQCYQCGRVAPPEALDNFTVKRYTLTALGENAAIFGMASAFREALEKDVKLTPVEVFKQIVNLESSRIQRYGVSRSSLVLLLMKNMDAIYLEAGGRAKELFTELSQIVKSMLRSSDIITSINDSMFIMLLLETPEEGSNIAVQRVREQIASLVQNNLSKQPEIIVRSLAIRSGNADELIDQLVNQKP